MMAPTKGRYGFWPLWPLAVALALGPTVGEAAAQQSDNDEPPEEAGEEAETMTRLVFEREVFNYPSHARDPFRPLTEDRETGPRFEDLRLLGVISGNSPETSIALVGVGSAGPGQAERLRVGDTLGNVRVTDVRPREVVVQVEEFGSIRERTLRVQRPGAEAGVEERPDEGDEDGDDGDDDGDDADDGDDSDESTASRGNGDSRSVNGAGGSR